MSLITVNERYLIPIKEYWEHEKEIKEAISNCESALDIFKEHYLGSSFIAEDYLTLIKALKEEIAQLLITKNQNQNEADSSKFDIDKESYRYLEFIDEYYKILINSRENDKNFDWRAKQRELDRKNKLMTSDAVLSFLDNELSRIKNEAEKEDSTKPVSETISEFDKLDIKTKKAVLKDIFLSFAKKVNEAKDKTCECNGHTLTEPIRKRETRFVYTDPTDPLDQRGKWLVETYDYQVCTLCGKVVETVISTNFPRVINFTNSIENMLSFAKHYLAGSARKKEEK